MPVLDARALDDDPEGLALLRGVLDTAEPSRRARRGRLPAKDAFDPARRQRAASKSSGAGEGASSRRLPALAMDS